MTERGRLERGLWVGMGTTFVAVGAMGVVVPLLPTTPFLILAGFCYARGSERLHSWLLEHKYLGVYLRAYERGEGVNHHIKALSLILLWVTMAVTIIFFIDETLVKILIVAIGLVVSAHILYLKGR